MNKDIGTLFFDAYFRPGRIFKKKLPLKFNKLLKIYLLLAIVSAGIMAVDYYLQLDVFPVTMFSLLFFYTLIGIPVIIYLINIQKKDAFKKSFHVFMLSTGIYLLVQPLAFFILELFSLFGSAAPIFSVFWFIFSLIAPLLILLYSLLIGYSNTFNEKKIKTATIILAYFVAISVIIYSIRLIA